MVSLKKLPPSDYLNVLLYFLGLRLHLCLPNGFKVHFFYCNFSGCRSYFGNRLGFFYLFYYLLIFLWLYLYKLNSREHFFNLLLIYFFPIYCCSQIELGLVLYVSSPLHFEHHNLPFYLLHQELFLWRFLFSFYKKRKWLLLPFHDLYRVYLLPYLLDLSHLSLLSFYLYHGPCFVPMSFYYYLRVFLFGKSKYNLILLCVCLFVSIFRCYLILLDKPYLLLYINRISPLYPFERFSSLVCLLIRVSISKPISKGKFSTSKPDSMLSWFLFSNYNPLCCLICRYRFSSVMSNLCSFDDISLRLYFELDCYPELHFSLSCINRLASELCVLSLYCRPSYPYLPYKFGKFPYRSISNSIRFPNFPKSRLLLLSKLRPCNGCLLYLGSLLSIVKPFHLELNSMIFGKMKFLVPYWNSRSKLPVIRFLRNKSCLFMSYPPKLWHFPKGHSHRPLYPMSCFELNSMYEGSSLSFNPVKYIFYSGIYLRLNPFHSLLILLMPLFFPSYPCNSSISNPNSIMPLFHCELRPYRFCLFPSSECFRLRVSPIHCHSCCKIFLFSTFSIITKIVTIMTVIQRLVLSYFYICSVLASLTFIF